MSMGGQGKMMSDELKSDQTLLLLMAEILHHLGCMKPYK